MNTQEEAILFLLDTVNEAITHYYSWGQDVKGDTLTISYEKALKLLLTGDNNMKFNDGWVDRQ